MDRARLVSVTETELFTVLRYEWSTGAATVYRERNAAPSVTLALRPAVVMEATSRVVSLLEKQAESRQQAEDITTDWDTQWSTHR